jgi:hypothetical protein
VWLLKGRKEGSAGVNDDDDEQLFCSVLSSFLGKIWTRKFGVSLLTAFSLSTLAFVQQKQSRETPRLLTSIQQLTNYNPLSAQFILFFMN